jgi:hypothetical protein
MNGTFKWGDWKQASKRGGARGQDKMVGNDSSITLGAGWADLQTEGQRK